MSEPLQVYIPPKDLAAKMIYTIKVFLERPAFRSEVALMLGTAAVESNFTYLEQTNDGPARGYFQMEPETAKDIYYHYLVYKPHLLRKLLGLIVYIPTEINISTDLIENWSHQLLKYNFNYMVAMARLHYLRDRNPIPNYQNVKELAEYWKTVYNTVKGKGKGKVEDFIRCYNHYDLNNIVSDMRSISK